MKLSMWMIANRLLSFDLELQIEENAPVNLNSARRAYATNCVHVYSQKEHTVCNGEGNIILIKNMDVTQAFEIIQSVFDFYEDWLDHFVSLSRSRNYQEAINLSWQIFHNPLMLFDGNSKVLGISEQYAPDSIDEEWRYLRQYGYSSLQAIQYMRYYHANINFTHQGFQAYELSEKKHLAYNGLSYCMFCNEVLCGRLNLLERDRKLNPGDYQILEKVSQLLEPSLGKLYYETYLQNSNVFYNILMGEPYEEHKLHLQLTYQQWSREDSFYLALIQITNTEEGEVLNNDLNILMHTILQQHPNCIVLKKTPFILVLSNKNLVSDESFLNFFTMLASNHPIQIGFSLPCKGLLNASCLFDQAHAALYYKNLYGSTSIFHSFFDYAIDFILESDQLKKSVAACHPDIVALWILKKETSDEMFDTLKTYLEHDCSLGKTAVALYIHRNTMIYRIKKIQEYLKDSLDHAYIKDYLRLSIRILELYTRKENLPLSFN